MDNPLEEYRKYYINQTVPDKFIQNGWLNLESRLLEQDKTSLTSNLYSHIIFISFLVAFLLFSSLVGAAQAAHPSTPLYPLKLLTEEAVVKLSGNNRIKIERRVQEVIDASKASSASAQVSLDNYQNTLDQVKKEAAEQGKLPELKNTLDQQAKKLEETLEDNHFSSEQIKQALKETRQVRSEVKGVSINNDEHREKDKNAQKNQKENPQEDTEN